MIPATTRDISTVISILPIRLDEYKPLIPTHYYIPACKDTNNGAETLMIERGSFRVYIDENRPALIIPEPSDVIANAICRDFKVSSQFNQPGEAEPGLFWVRGGYDKKEVLSSNELKPSLVRAREMQNEWFTRLIKEADDSWSRNRMRKEISDLQRLAVKSLALKRDWDIDLEISSAVHFIKCKFCRADVHPEAVICMHCRGVLNMERFKSEFVSADGPVLADRPAK